MAEVSSKSTGRKLQQLAKYLFSAGQKTNSMTKTKFQTEMPKTDAETPNVTNSKITNEVSKCHLAVKVH